MFGQYPAESHVISREGREIPVIAFFGAKGGVGKTTIARLFAELVNLHIALELIGHIHELHRRPRVQAKLVAHDDVPGSRRHVL